eukprot:TRINITY_DN189_c0_g3_i6.p3 TRINITY_DN189_c0_g3~~TRINITY_DN189_c0_g3_i6.p3  ORF type:complete len:227 (-),score=-3.00 TRINITY_DN189_c0_g3_i6:15-695(-)
MCSSFFHCKIAKLVPNLINKRSNKRSTVFSGYLFSYSMANMLIRKRAPVLMREWLFHSCNKLKVSLKLQRTSALKFGYVHKNLPQIAVLHIKFRPRRNALQFPKLEIVILLLQKVLLQLQTFFPLRVHSCFAPICRLFFTINNLVKQCGLFLLQPQKIYKLTQLQLQNKNKYMNTNTTATTTFLLGYMNTITVALLGQKNSYIHSKICDISHEFQKFLRIHSNQKI